jgi:hypothetical protein
VDLRKNRAVRTRSRWAHRPTDVAAISGYVRVVANRHVSDAARARANAQRSTHRTRVLGSSLVIASLIGCGIASADVSAPRPDQRAPEGRSSPVASPRPVAKVFFVKGEQFAPRTRVVPPGKALATAAVEALLAGPSASERAAGIDTTLPRGVRLASLAVKTGTATVRFTHPQSAATAFDVSLRPARAAQVVYTLTAIPGVRQVLISVNGVDRATFIGSKLAVKGALAKHDLSKPITLPKKATRVPKGPAPADPRGVQRRLASLRFLPSAAVNGAWNERTRHAVIAFQAWHRLDRDGIVGPQTLAALENASQPKPRRSPGGRHVEVYRQSGVTLLAEGGKVVRALHSSTGARGYETPAGTYEIFRKERNSWSVPYQVWLPYASYFNGGIAFHAYPEVPARPASHGCVRLPVAEAPFAYSFMALGTRVTVL